MKMNNELVDSYLDLYSKIDNPGHAVLVKGEWGAGKTYKVIKKLGAENIYYISLFGLGSQREIYSAVFLSMFPAKAVIPKITSRIKDALKGTEKITFGVPGVVNGLTEAFIKEKVKKDKVIVFDDLERSNLSLNEVLGCINKYVEHHECRVIVIAHDESIYKELDKVKEKIFGQILLIQPDIEDAHKHFISTSRSPSAAKEIEEYILYSFSASKCQSLRILKQTIDDCLRLYSCLEKKHIAKASSFRNLMSMFCGISISFRDGKITKEDIKKRSIVAYLDYNVKDENDKSSFGKMKERFKEANANIDFDSRILSDDILINTICNGYYNKEEIISYLDSSHYFGDPTNSPAWVSLFNFDSLDDQSIRIARERIEKEESQFEITDIGDILHIFCLKCLLSLHGEISKSFDEIEEDTSKYVSDLLSMNKLPASTRDARETHYEHQDHAHGHGYWIKDDYRINFERITKYITLCRDRALEKNFPSNGQEVLGYLKTDVHEFRKVISAGPYTFGKYSNLPILKTIPPGQFVKAWLSIPRENWSVITKALESRYNLGMLDNYLVDEVSWIESVKNELKKAAAFENGLSKLRIERLIPRVNNLR